MFKMQALLNIAYQLAHMVFELKGLLKIVAIQQANNRSVKGLTLSLDIIRYNIALLSRWSL